MAEVENKIVLSFGSGRGNTMDVFLAKGGRKASLVGGLTKKDGLKLHNDILSVIKDPKFDAFKLLLKRGEKNNKNTFDKIDKDTLKVSLNKLEGDNDALKFVKIVANTINDDKPVIIKFYNGNQKLENKENTIQKTVTFKAFVLPMNAIIRKTMLNNTEAQRDRIAKMEKDPDKKAVILAKTPGVIDTDYFLSNRGGGLTTSYDGGTYCIVDTSHMEYSVGVTSLHEIFGHGRPISIGRTTHADEDAIRFENLVWRLLKKPGKQRNGHDHGERNGVALPNPKKLPDFE